MNSGNGLVTIDQVSASAPEPSTFLLAGCALALLVLTALRRDVK